MANPLIRAADSSAAVRYFRRLGRGSLLVAVAAAVFRPSLAYLGGSLAPESEAQASAAITRMCTVASDSALVGTGLRAVALASASWCNSGTARLGRQFRSLELGRRIQLVGWVAFLGTLIGGVAQGIWQGPWPASSVLVWVAAIAFAVVLALGHRALAAAWKRRRA